MMPEEPAIPRIVSEKIVHATFNRGSNWRAGRARISPGKVFTAISPTKIYAYYGAEVTVANVHAADEGHDYGPNKREAAYRFLAAHLGLTLAAAQGADGKIDESHVTIEPPAALHVFTADYPIPPTALHDAQAIEQALKKLQR